MIKQVLSILVLLCAPLALAQGQTTTTYTTTGETVGTYTSPFRAFNIALTNGASIPWLEQKTGSVNPQCGVTTSAPGTIGFIFLDGTVANEGYITDPNNPWPCFNLTYTSLGYVEFAGITGSGRNFTGSFSYAFSFTRSPGRFSHTVFHLTNGTLAITIQ